MRAKEQRREALKSEMNNSSKSVSLLNEF